MARLSSGKWLWWTGGTGVFVHLSILCPLQPQSHSQSGSSFVNRARNVCVCVCAARVSEGGGVNALSKVSMSSHCFFH